MWRFFNLWGWWSGKWCSWHDFCSSAIIDGILLCGSRQFSFFPCDPEKPKGSIPALSRLAVWQNIRLDYQDRTSSHRHKGKHATYCTMNLRNWWVHLSFLNMLLRSTNSIYRKLRSWSSSSSLLSSSRRPLLLPVSSRHRLQSDCRHYCSALYSWDLIKLFQRRVVIIVVDDDDYNLITNKMVQVAKCKRRNTKILWHSIILI